MVINVRSRAAHEGALDEVCVKDRNAYAIRNSKVLPVVFGNVRSGARALVSVMPRMTTLVSVRMIVQEMVVNSRKSIVTREVKLCMRRDRIRDVCVTTDTAPNRTARTNLAESRDVTRELALTVFVSVL